MKRGILDLKNIFETMSLYGLGIILFISIVVVIISSIKLTKLADILADYFHLGEAFVGSVFVGATTSLIGVIVTSKTAWDGYPDLAISNVVGSIAIQTVFLVVSDFMYRPSNLEHAAASIANIFSGILLIILLATPLAVQFTSPMEFFGIHPISPVIILVYILGLRIQRSSFLNPMWLPKLTKETFVDRPREEMYQIRPKKLVLNFILLIPIVAFSGLILSLIAESLVARQGLSEGVVGTFITGISTSLPELIVTLTAVKQGSLTLAVGNIIGGNTFDVLQIPVADVLYRKGSIYHHLDREQLFMMAMTLLMTAVLSLGLLLREKKGPINIGFEGIIIIILYISSVCVYIN